MQKVTKLALLVALPLVVVVAIAAGVYVGSGSSKDGARASTDDRITTLLQHIPADTPLVFVGRYDSDSIEYTDAFMRRSNPEDLEEVADLLRSFSDSSEANLLSWLLEDYARTSATGGVSGVEARYGIDMTGAYAAYFHGAAPVIRLPLDGSEQLVSVLAEAQEDTGGEYREESLGDTSLRVWPLHDEFGVELALLLEDDWLTLSVIHSSDSPDARLQRFARAPSGAALADSEQLEQLRADYADADTFMGYVDVHQILQAVLLPEQNSTGRELLEWFPEFAESLEEGPSAECRRDTVGLAAQMPRLSMGMHETSRQGDAIHQRMGVDWRIESAAVMSSLQKMQGFVPEYSRRHDDKRLAFALGLDMSQLVPVATELWTQFTSAHFECPELIEMQQTVQGFNPAMLAMMGAAMVDSVRGAGFAIYDINEQATTTQELLGSTLVSLSSEDPSAIAAMLGMYLPQMGGISIPEDGTPVALPETMGVTGFQAAIKGKHLVLFRGDAAQRDAEALASEPLNKDGLTSAAVNLRDFSGLMNLPQELLGEVAGGQCATLLGGALTMTSLEMAFGWTESLGDSGWVSELDFVSGILPTLEARDLAGEYRLMAMDDYDCRWHAIGSESLGSDGTGEYVGTNEEQGCENYQSEFEWQLLGGLLRQTPVSQRERFDCNAEWNEAEQPDPFSCEVMHESSEGFYCLSTGEEGMDLYRYIAQ